MKLRRYRTALLCLALTALGGAVEASGQVEALRRDLDGILRTTGWRSAEWGVLAISLDVRDTLFAREAAHPLVPASNIKLLTTSAALHFLGADYRFETFVLADGGIDEWGRLDGDIILYGTGDPGLSERFHRSRTSVFEALADQLVAAGIRTVNGGVLGDGTFFDGPLLHPGWDVRDLNDWFAAPSSALGFNENMVSLRVEPGPWDGAPPVIHTLPEEAGLPIDNQASTGWGRRLTVDRRHPSHPIEVMGTLARGQPDVWRRLTVRDPARYAAQAFRNVLGQRGIIVEGSVGSVGAASSGVTGQALWAPAVRGPAPRVLARHRSAPLLDYLRVINKESHNLLADMVLKAVGRVVEGDGSFSGGGRAVRRFLEDEVGIADADFDVQDGSGLTEGNRVSPAVFVRLLDYMAGSELWTDFWATLPEAGNRRELGRMYRTAAAGNLRAKTGTIHGVSALSGMVRSASGERIAFSIIGNGLPSTWSAKRVEDRIGARLASFRRPMVANAEQDHAAALPSAAPIGARVDTKETSLDGSPRSAEVTRHQVARGESFSIIAERYGVPLATLLDANREIPPDYLQAGEWILVPGPARPSR
ncbi:MAG TPA: D-alanyl-D-alanine carboxypeptidase/D-alanyl-D-alanine-endopeptidase [Longimicrobiales bacterium]|jgi:D-alanyl-D-alanine carboxypeptidase/D-alanyl-D-alanine-endopeptidase (penicillin-binding protein 4)